MNILSSFSAVGFVAWLADFYLLATLLILIAIVARRWIRQPAQRLTVHWIVALELALLAVVCALPFWPRISLVGAASQKSEVESPIPAGHNPMSVSVPLPRTPFPPKPLTDTTFDAPSHVDLPEETSPPIAPQPRWTWVELAAAAYLTSAGLVISWLLWGAVAAASVCRHAENAPESLQEELARVVGAGGRVPQLLVSSRVTTAVALGLRRPTILLPAALVQDGSPHALRAVLTHEWTHIRNGDLWLLALGRCLLVLLFPHPLLWWLRRAIRGDQELLADAAAAGDNRPAYAEELLRLVRKTTYPSPIAASAAVGIWEGSSQLSRRIAMLLDENFRVEPRATRRWRYRVLTLLAVLGATCSLMTVQPARSNSPLPYSGEGQGVRASDAPRSGTDTPRSSTGVEPGVTAPSTAPLNSVVTGDTVIFDDNFDDGPDAVSIALPVYRLHLLTDPAVRRELKLTVEQINKLHAIQVKYDAEDAESRKSYDEATKKKLPQDELAKLARKLNTTRSQWMQGTIKEIRMQAMEVLTAGQIQSLKELTVRELAYSRLMEASQPTYSRRMEAKGFDGLGLAKEQNGALAVLRKEANDWFDHYHQAMSDKVLSVLTPQQQARLREEALGPLGPGDDPELLTVKLKGESEPVQVFSLAPYPDFTQASVRKELGLSAAQEQHVQDILGGSTNLSEKLTRDLEKLSPPERKKLRDSYADALSTVWSLREYASSPEEMAKEMKEMIEERKKNRAGFAEQPVMKPAIALRKQFEAVLTPQQLARYRDLAVRNYAAHAVDGIMLPMVGASQQQQAELQRFVHDLGAKGPPHFRDLGRRLLQILTPPQQEKLRSEFEAQIVTFETVSDSLVQAPDGDSRNLVTTGSGAVTFTGSPANNTLAATGSGMTTIVGPPANNLVVTGSVMTTFAGSSAAKSPTGAESDFFALPVYSDLNQPHVQKELNLTAQEKATLREIAARFVAAQKGIETEIRTFRKTGESMSPQERKTASTAISEKWDKLKNDIHKQVDAALTPQHLQALHELTFRHSVFWNLTLNYASYAETLALTAAQKEKLHQLQSDVEDREKRQLKEETAKALAELSPAQRVAFRKSVLDPRNQPTILSTGGRMTLIESGPVDATSFAYVSTPADRTFVVPGYAELGQEHVRKELKLGAEQTKQLLEISHKRDKLVQKEREEAKNLSPEEQEKSRAALRARRIQWESDACKEIEGVLTPQQLAALAEMKIAEPPGWYALQTPSALELLTPSDEQKAAWKRLAAESKESGRKAFLENTEKALTILTPLQQQKLRERMEREGE